ncbi:MAG: PQQ-dependent sugar dehydrogenase [Planctomycetaceae bacterium]
MQMPACCLRPAVALSCLITFAPGATWFASVSADDQLQATAAQRTAWTASKITGTPDPPPPYIVEPAFQELTFRQPLDLCVAPGSNRLFVAEQRGTIQSFVNRADVATIDPVVNLKESHPELTALYAITFHPKFQQNRYVYVCYIQGADKEDGTFVSRFEMSDTDPPTLDPATEKVIIRWWSGGHNGCSLKFGPDGFLYISTGDGGAPSPPDPLLAGQDVTNLLSCILRIDVDLPGDGELAYRVPNDNPLIGISDARPEIWSYGFRNPWRMSFDSVTGDLWVGDVGWQLYEMIYRVERGGNYGWPIMEGPQPALPESQRGPTPILPPVVSHPHSEAASVTGGYVYHGTRLPELQNVYIYGDYQSGIVWGLKHDGTQVTWHEELARTPLQLVSFGQDHQGELYLVDYQRSQKIYRLIPNPDVGRTSDFPQRLSETGIFRSVEQQTPEAGVRSYRINAPHWADHTTSERWMALPGTDSVQVESDERWKFPEGSVLAKTVSIRLQADDPGSTRRLETQILHREGDCWRPYTYAWNDDQTDAELVPAAGFTRPLRIRDANAPGGVREQNYRFAARNECQMCHNPWVEARTTILGFQSASPLAVTVAQLNRDSDASDASPRNQLQQLHDEGWLAGKLPENPSTAVRLSDPYDESADLNERVRSYLHVNCAQCHQPHAGGSSTIELTYQAKLESAGLLGVRPAQGTFGISDASLIAPGDPLGSVLHYRMAKVGNGRMPRTGSDEVDERAVAMIYRWIQQLPATESAQNSNAQSLNNTISELSTATAEQRAAAVQQWTSSTRSALMLLQWLVENETADDVRQFLITEAAGHSRPEIRDLFERFLPVSQRARRLGTTVDTAQLLSLPGDIEKGRRVFFAEGTSACRSCHRIRESGETLGPDLTLIGKKYVAAEMLLHLLEPSRFIDPKYVGYVLETTDGQIYTGLLLTRNDREVVLKTAQNKEVRVPAENVEELVSQQKSLMPDLLLRDMTPEQVADLLAFLCSLK